MEKKLEIAASGPKGLAIGAQYIAAAAVWGASFLFIKVSVTGLSPAQVVAGRLVLGALVLAGIMFFSKRRWPRGIKVWGHFAAMGVLMCVAPFLLFSWAAQYLPSGLSSIYNATTPIATMLVALAILPDERLTLLRSAAIVVAAGGIVIVAAPWTFASQVDRPEFLWAQGACLVATTCYGLGFSYTRRFLRNSSYDSTTISASQIGCAALITVVLLPFIGNSPIEVTPAIVASMVVLGAVGTGIAYVWYTNVINAWGATIASTVTYLTPITGVLLGILVLGESLHWNEIVGVLVVVVAILISQGRFSFTTVKRGKKE